MEHKKYAQVKKVIKAGMPVLLEGPAGSGKTTMAMHVAKELGLTFASISMTKQTSVNALIGFISVTGEYIGTNFRKAFEEGHLFLIDELDAADPNVILILNTIENGYIAFPDGIIKMHKDFRLVATANPQDQHTAYTGRSKLDFSTLDRYWREYIDMDGNLEEDLTSPEVHQKCEMIRSFLKSKGASLQVTMRDAIRIQGSIDQKLTSDPYSQVIFLGHSDLEKGFKKDQKRLEKEAEEKRIAEEAERARKEEERKAKEAYDKLTQHEVDTYNELISKIKEGK